MTLKEKLHLVYVLKGIPNFLAISLKEMCGIMMQLGVNFELKGSNPLTENYSVLSPEVINTIDGETIAHKNTNLINKLLDLDKVFLD